MPLHASIKVYWRAPTCLNEPIFKTNGTGCMKAAKQYGWTTAMIIVCAIGSALVSADERDIAAPLPPLASDGVHAPANPALPSLQTPDESMANIPKDRRAEVQWVEALKQGEITPRKYVAGDEGKEQ